MEFLQAGPGLRGQRCRGAVSANFPTERSESDAVKDLGLATDVVAIRRLVLWPVAPKRLEHCAAFW
jgi:hypothetical protein